jgi:hypothetical protein
MRPFLPKLNTNYKDEIFSLLQEEYTNTGRTISGA